jgi:RNA polymerase sigma factor for flagellar operon FliA
MTAPQPGPSPARSLSAVDPTDASIDRLVGSHLGLVHQIVSETSHRLPGHVGRDDRDGLVSAGMYALLMSARTFDAGRGVPFARYAAIRIRGALTDELRARDWATRSVRTRSREIERTRDELAARLGRSASRDEIAAALGVSAAEVEDVDAEVIRATVVSYSGLDWDTAASTLAAAADDAASPEATLLRRERIGYLYDAIAELPERLRRVVCDYFFGQRRLVDIAASLGVTESRASQLRTEALTLLRAAVTNAENPGPAAGATAIRRGGVRQARVTRYCTAVATRSTLAGRLARTTVSGEPLELRRVS